MIIKVKNLIEELHKQDPEAIVLIASDDEGSSFRYLLGLHPELCLGDERKQVDVYNEEDLDELGLRNYIEKAVALYPKCT